MNSERIVEEHSVPIETALQSHSGAIGQNATVFDTSLEQNDPIFYHIVQEITKKWRISRADSPQLDQTDTQTPHLPDIAH